MIFRRGARLYEKCEDYITIYIYMYKSGNIKTYWRSRSRSKIKNRNKKGREILKNLKVNGCAICGYNKCSNSLDFHHVNPEDKKFQLVATEMFRPPLTLVEELNKCILVCKNCHYEIHTKERNKNVFYNKSNS